MRELRFSSLAAMPWQNLEARHSETFRGISSVLFYSIACRFDGNVACRTARRIGRKKHRKGRPPGAMVSIPLERMLFTIQPDLSRKAIGSNPPPHFNAPPFREGPSCFSSF